MASTAIFRIAQRALEHLLEQPCALVGKEPQGFHGLVGAATANERRKRTNLPSGHVREAMMRCVFHDSTYLRWPTDPGIPSQLRLAGTALGSCKAVLAQLPPKKVPGA